MDRYAKNSGAVFSLKAHLVWCPKYRRSVLVDPIDKRLKELLFEKCEELGIKLHTLEVMPDHVHVFLEYDPTRGIAEIANRLKGFTSRILRQEFKSLKSRLPTLWSRSYFAASIGAITEASVKKYIENQKGK
jgi:putative transposase